MQTPRLVARRSRGQWPAMGAALIIALALFWVGLPSFIRVIKSMEDDPKLNQGNPAANRLETALDEGDDEDAKNSEEEKAFEKGAVREDNSINYLDPKLDDPMSSFIIGYPMEPLSLEQLRLCDAEQTIMLQGSYRCSDDPSCLKCVAPKQAERFRELIGAYRDTQIEAERKAQLEKDFAGQHTVVMFTFNYAHSDLFLNWACSAHKLGIDVKEFTLVIPCDEQSTELVQSLGFKILDPAWQKKLSKPIKSGESYWGQDHADINNLALFTMVDLLDLGFHVFVHDADVAWTQNPLPFFQNAIRRRDFLGMLAPFWNSMGPVNTGLLYIAPTLQSKVFLKSMENAAIVKGTSDQRLWNAILRHFSFQQLEWRLLPQAIIYKYSGRRAPPPDKRTLLMHAVGTNKREKLARYNLWLLEPACPYYNADVAVLNKAEVERVKQT